MPDKNYIFGYGSLVSATDVERTLGHPPESLTETVVPGWVRDWSIILDNTSTIRRYETVPDRTVPKFVVILNLHLPRDGEVATNPNGVLFPVTDDEMRKMDERENHYQRVDITDYVDNKPQGHVYAYVGMEKYIATPALRKQSILPGSYRELVEKGFLSFGDASLQKFRISTIAPDVPEKPTVHTSNVQ
ncbi:MAG: gamma-glutamylcyclotransferase family protein [Candidatus Saccharimonadales bacterium]